MNKNLTALFPLLLCLSTGCTLLQIDTCESPPGFSSKGLIDAHMVFGVSEEDSLVRASFFDRAGTIFELGLWKLFRLEVGLAGAALGVGPLDMGLGIGFYKPHIPVARHADEATIIDVYEEPDGRTRSVRHSTKKR